MPFNSCILNSVQILRLTDYFMYYSLVSALFVVAFGAVAWQVVSRMRALAAPETTSSPVVSAERYRPMLRLLSDEDLNFIPAKSGLRRSLRTRRRELFRSYLRCLARDYAHLLAGVRTVMVQSGMDRPELARALAKNRTLFLMLLYKVEFRLTLHAIGVGKVEVSGLVEALEGLRNQVNVLSALPTAA
jgi:hypothetical protein